MRFPKIHFILLLLFSLFASVLIAQKNCVITGKILDKATGETMIGATVHVDSTDIGVITDIEGIYSLSLPPGSYTLNILYVGMAPGKISVEGKEGEVVHVDFAMDLARESALEEVVVKATADRSSDVVMNLELKKAAYIASGITSSEIRKTPDRTVGDILKRVTGASIQDGKFVIIRGMNDRYNAGYLDGSLLSSTEADRKAFAFDVIPAALIDNLVIIKSGSPDLIGDFGGGVIKINTKSVPDKLTQNITVGAQFHSLTSSKPFTE
ncbi:MAG TPA: TonB-dependent receptor, partial [Saprospiraceae bacterium]|nr:TonB-dependent receptor [Saprospiraceae bacterium]